MVRRAAREDVRPAAAAAILGWDVAFLATGALAIVEVQLAGRDRRRSRCPTPRAFYHELDGRRAGKR